MDKCKIGGGDETVTCKYQDVTIVEVMISQREIIIQYQSLMRISTNLRSSKDFIPKAMGITFRYKQDVKRA